MTGEQLKSWQRRHGFTNWRAAEIFKVGVATVANYRCGRFNIPPRVEEIAKNFDRKLFGDNKISRKEQLEGALESYLHYYFNQYNSGIAHTTLCYSTTLKQGGSKD